MKYSSVGHQHDTALTALGNEGALLMEKEAKAQMPHDAETS